MIATLFFDIFWYILVLFNIIFERRDISAWCVLLRFSIAHDSEWKYRERLVFLLEDGVVMCFVLKFVPLDEHAENVRNIIT